MYIKLAEEPILLLWVENDLKMYPFLPEQSIVYTALDKYNGHKGNPM